MSTHRERMEKFFDRVVEEEIIDAVKKEEGLDTRGPFILCCQAFHSPDLKKDTCFTGK